MPKGVYRHLGHPISDESKQKISAAITKHGMSRSSEYKSWCEMKSRCREDSTKRQWYAGRGIAVCDRWLEFENFFKDMGHKPSPQYTIDRIDNDLGYSPGNCRWATRKEQANNRRPRVKKLV